MLLRAQKHTMIAPRVRQAEPQSTPTLFYERNDLEGVTAVHAAVLPQHNSMNNFDDIDLAFINIFLILSECQINN